MNSLHIKKGDTVYVNSGNCKGQKGKVLKVLVYTPVKLLTMPIYFLGAPFVKLGTIIQRKSENYADSFAAAYGYGAELASASEKIHDESNNGLEGTILEPFNVLYRLEAEIFCSCVDVHGTPQQRVKSMVDSLDMSLKDSNLSKNDKAAIKAERDRLMAFYDYYVSAPPKSKDALSKTYRAMLDGWYNGKNYMFTPVFAPDQTYAR